MFLRLYSLLFSKILTRVTGGRSGQIRLGRLPLEFFQHLLLFRIEGEFVLLQHFQHLLFVLGQRFALIDRLERVLVELSRSSRRRHHPAISRLDNFRLADRRISASRRRHVTFPTNAVSRRRHLPSFFFSFDICCLIDESAVVMKNTGPTVAPSWLRPCQRIIYTRPLHFISLGRCYYSSSGNFHSE